MGLGRRGGGVGATNFLTDVLGHDVVVSDLLPSGDLAESIARITTPSRVDLTLLGHRQEDLELSDYDLVVRNPAVPIDAPALHRARLAGVPVHTEISLFVEHYPGTIIGVTGSKGKTSTCFFLEHLLKDVVRTHVVGNMGGACLDAVANADSDSVAILELSAFQVESLTERQLSVPIAVLTTLHDDHLDRYPDRAAYWSAKAGLFAAQTTDQWRVHPTASLPSGYADAFRGAWIDSGSPTAHPGAIGRVWVAGDHLLAESLTQRRMSVAQRGAIPVADDHRLENVASAVSVALLLGADPRHIAEELTTLPVVPHRMEPIELGGDSSTAWINDSAASNPTAAAAGVRSRAQAGSIAVICGGSSKDLDLTPLVDALVQTSARVILLPGVESEILRQRLHQRGVLPDGPVTNMDEAVSLARSMAVSTVLLCPGCASFATDGHDGFADEFDRGGQFVAAVLDSHGVALPSDIRSVLGQPRRPAIGDLLVESRRKV